MELSWCRAVMLAVFVVMLAVLYASDMSLTFQSSDIAVEDDESRADPRVHHALPCRGAGSAICNSSTEVCVRGFDCPAHCMAVGRQCLSNVFVLTSPNASQTSEIVCENRPPATRPPHIFNERDPVAVFKNNTAWAFKQWWDWNATCVPPASDEDAVFRMVFEEWSQEFVLENVCIRGVGRMAGYNVSRKFQNQFSARTELEHKIPFMNNYFRSVKHLFHPPECFVDVDVILVAEDQYVQNNVFALHRFAQVALMQRFHYPKPDDPPHPRDETYVTNRTTRDGRPTIVGHVWVRDLSIWNKFDSNFMRYYFPLMGDAWFSVMGSRKLAKHISHVIGGEEGIERLGETLLCFKKVRIAHTCVGTFCGKTPFRPNVPFLDKPGQRYKLSLFVPRTPYDTFVLKWLRQKMAQCVGVPLRDQPNTERPAVLIGHRSKTRRYSHQSARVYPIVRRMETLYNASSVQFIELTRAEPNDVVRAFLNADVVISQHGGNLGWVFLMPSGASVVEMVGRDFGCPIENFTVPGFFQCANCEFAGYASALSLRYFLTAIPGRVRENHHVTYHTWKTMMDVAMCALRWNGTRVYTPVNDSIALTTEVMRDAFSGLVAACETPDSLVLPTAPPKPPPPTKKPKRRKSSNAGPSVLPTLPPHR